jgi:predicted DNA-binding protein (MmcQ/YjbR family)
LDIDKLRDHCLNKAGVSEGFPFDDETLVFKVGRKIFCLVNLNFPLSINLKCNPEKAIELREEYEEIIPGYHMNKKHWNTISLEGNLEDDFIKEMIDHSYFLVYNKLTQKEKDGIKFDN